MSGGRCRQAGGAGLSRKLSRVVVVLLIVGQLVAVPILRFEYVRVRWSFVAILVLDAYLATRVFRAAGPRERIRLAALLGVPLCVMAALAGPSGDYMGAAVGPLLLGWVAPLAILAWEGGGRRRRVSDPVAGWPAARRDVAGSRDRTLDCLSAARSSPDHPRRTALPAAIAAHLAPAVHAAS